MRMIVSKFVDSKIKTRYIKTCDSCGKTLVDEDANPDKYIFYRLTFGEISYDENQTICYRYHGTHQLDICEDCKNAIDSAVEATIKSLKNKEDQNNG